MDEKIAVLADSCCDISEELQKEYEIRVLPVHIIYPEGDYLDGAEIEAQTVYDRFPGEIPHTSMPSPGEALDFIERIRDDGYTHLIAICVSDHLSSTVDLIHNIACEVEGLATFVYNTRDISFGSGVYAVWAAEQIRRGKSFKEICDGLEAKRADSHLMFYMDSLEYLRRGGRIGNVAGLVASTLKIKPIIACDDEGVYYTVAKIRGEKKSKARLLAEIIRAVGGRKCWLAIMNGGCPEEGARMQELVQEAIPQGTVIMPNHQINASLAIHTGPGLIGLLAFT